jgi:TPP-dependent pyruvate/acetoin dehydrogenase alpha subunit
MSPSKPAPRGAKRKSAGRPRAASPSAPAAIEDYRLERPRFEIEETVRNGEHGYRCDVPAADPPPLRETGSLNRGDCLELYRFMLLNRLMEQQLENLYKQGKVVGGVYFGLGQEANSVASAYALAPQDWMAPLIRNQGSLLVRGFRARDVMMQYMARAGSPTRGRDGSSHFGQLDRLHVVAPISMLGDLIPVMAGVCLGERMQGRQVAAMTWIGDGGQSTGVFHEGLNLAAVQRLGLVLVVENNLWAYSTPVSKQARVADLAVRAQGYGVPAIIVDGTDALQVYDAALLARDRAHAGGGPTFIESKLMRMKGHAIHDSAGYVPANLFDYWKKRDPIARFERYLASKKWLSPADQQKMRAQVERELVAERDAAEAAPMPEPSTALAGVYCDEGCHRVRARFESARGATAPRS